jgi:hypothetical protein
MTSDHPSTTSTPHGPGPARGPARPDPLPLLQGLERIRDTLRQRLDRLEAMVHERAAAPGAEPSVREFELRKRIGELEERQRMLVSEARRREQEHDAAMAKLEDDRRLLADAWDRLEQERTGCAAHPAAQVNHHPPAAPPPKPVFRPVVANETDDAVAQAILKQFQALRSDVRRNASGRRTRR